MSSTRRFNLDGELPLWSTLYERNDYISSGTYGDVFTATERATKKTVAIKRLRPTTDHAYRLACREVYNLEKLDHPNIIRLENVVCDEKGVRFMVMDCMKHDLEGLLKNKDAVNWMSVATIKSYMRQILSGIDYCHQGKLLHRDLKPANILLSDKGVIKIADFGLCRTLKSRIDETVDPKHDGYTNPVQSRYYRCPEMLLGSRTYDYSSDVWSIGCIFVELLLGQVFMPGKYDDPSMCGNEHGTDQLSLIWSNCGTPLENNWPSVVAYPKWPTFRPQFSIARNMHTRLHTNNKTPRKHYFTNSAIDLVDKLLLLDPKNRITCQAALRHVYLVEESPAPLPTEALPRYSMPNYACVKRFKPTKK